MELLHMMLILSSQYLANFSANSGYFLMGSTQNCLDLSRLSKNLSAAKPQDMLLGRKQVERMLKEHLEFFSGNFMFL